jgi:hypothetical protein
VWLLLSASHCWDADHPLIVQTSPTPPDLPDVVIGTTRNKPVSRDVPTLQHDEHPGLERLAGIHIEDLGTFVKIHLRRLARRELQHRGYPGCCLCQRLQKPSHRGITAGIPMAARVHIEHGQQSHGVHIILFLLSTGTRLNEALRARWEHIDVERRIWRIPATNSKSGKVRAVPLNDSAIGVLNRLDTEGKLEHVFINRKNGPAEFALV